MKRRRPWSLPKLLEHNRDAATVFMVLVFMAGDRRQIGTTREKIREACPGLTPRRIGKAVQTLHDAAWLTRQYGQNGPVSWYRIVLPVVDFSPVVAPRAHRARGGVRANDTQAIRPCVRATIPHPLTGIADGSGSTAGPPAPSPSQDPIANIERERIEAIRRARTSGEPIGAASGGTA